MNVTLFVYGTLAPGERAWRLLQHRARDVRPATVSGRLYDTGHGYPAAVFAPGDARVHGWCCEVDETVLAELDSFEGDEYGRAHVNTDDGMRAVAYEWQASLEGSRPIAGGRWPPRATARPR